MKTSTNALTARYCAMMGWDSDTVQSWRGKQRHDLFGLYDTVIFRPPAHLNKEIDPDRRVWVFVQNCAYGTLSAHKKAMDAHPMRRHLGMYSISEVWEWRKKKADGRGQWFRRTQQMAVGVGEWGELSGWEGPLDLYPKKAKA